MVERSSHILGILHIRVIFTLRRIDLHPYHFQCIQHQHPGDSKMRRILLADRWSSLINILNVLFKDEATFHSDGLNNNRNNYCIALQQKYCAESMNIDNKRKIRTVAAI